MVNARMCVIFVIPFPCLPCILLDHIQHIKKNIGVDHVGIGSDFDGIEM